MQVSVWQYGGITPVKPICQGHWLAAAMKTAQHLHGIADNGVNQGIGVTAQDQMPNFAFDALVQMGVRCTSLIQPKRRSYLTQTQRCLVWMRQVMCQSLLRCTAVCVAGCKTFLLAGDARDEILRELQALDCGQLRQFGAHR